MENERRNLNNVILFNKITNFEQKNETKEINYFFE